MEAAQLNFFPLIVWLAAAARQIIAFYIKVTN